MSIFFLATETWWSESSRSFFELWLISIFKLNYLGSFRFDLLHQDFNRIFLELSQINRLKSSRFFLLHQKPGCTNVPKTDFHTEFTESSNLIFCVATRLVSPINVSVDSSILVEKGSTEKFLNWFLYQIFDVRKRTEGCVLNHLGFQNHVSPLVEARFFPLRS